MGEYRLRKQSEDAFDLYDSGLNASDHGSIVGIAPGGSFMAFGGTNNTDVNNRIHTTTDYGKTWTREADGGFPALNAAGSGFRAGKVKIWGGNGASGTILSSWEWDKVTGTVQISAAMTGYSSGGSHRSQATYLDTGSLFVTIGGVSADDVIISSDLITWTQSMVLPVDCQNSAGATAFKYKGEYYYITGQKNDTAAYPGKVYKFNSDFTAMELVLENELFETKWKDATGGEHFVFLIRGHKDVGGNQKGCYINEGDLANINDYKRLPYEIPATHANPVTMDLNDLNAVTYCGNMRNDCWRLEKIA